MNVRVLKPLHVKGKTIDVSEKTWDIEELGLSVENAKTLIKVEAIEEVKDNAKKR